MLEKLFGSQTRLKLLKAFLFQPERRYMVEELAHLHKLKAESLRRELDNLLGFGLISQIFEKKEILPDEPAEEVVVEKPKKGKIKEKETEKEIEYYQLERSFVLVEELKTLIARAQVLYERDFVDKLLTTGTIKYLMLTGFFVNRTDSPVDLLVVGRINKAKLVKIIKEFEQELGREVNFTHFELTEFVYRKSLADVFIYELLEGPNLVVINEING